MTKTMTNRGYSLSQDPTEQSEGADQAVLGDSLHVTNAKVFIGGQEIGVCNEASFDLELPKIERRELPKMGPITFEMKLENPKETFKAFKRLFKLPRKLKKKTYGTRSAKKKLLRMIKAGLPITQKHFKRAGYKVKITPANFA